MQNSKSQTTKTKENTTTLHKTLASYFILLKRVNKSIMGAYC